MAESIAQTKNAPSIASAGPPAETDGRLRPSTSLDGILSQEKTRFGVLARHWRTIRKAGALTPDRSDFDPTAIRRILPNIHLMEFVDDDHLIYRLIGHEEVRRLGNDLKGVNYFDRIDPEVRQLARRLFPDLFRHCCGVIVSANEIYDDGSTVRADYLGLPLAQKDAPARFVISVIESKDAAIEAPLCLTDRPVLKSHQILAIQPVDIGAGAPSLNS